MYMHREHCLLGELPKTFLDAAIYIGTISKSGNNDISRYNISS